MKKFLFISVLFFSGRSIAQPLQTVTTSGNTTTNVIRFSGNGLLGTSGTSELVVGVFPTGPITNDTRVFIGRKAEPGPDAAHPVNPTTNGPAGTLLLQARSNIDYLPIDFVTGNPNPILRMRIAGNGNVSIGDNGAPFTATPASLAPAARLLVKGEGTTSSTSALIVQNSAATTNLQVFDNGNVGIGTGSTTAAERLTVIGNAIIGQNTANSSAVKVDITSGASSQDAKIDFGYYTTFDAAAYMIGRWGSDASFRISDYPTGTEVNRFYIGSNGNVGIGTTAPSAKLHVAGKTVIGTGLTTFPGTYNLYVSGGILTEKIKAALSTGAQWADYVFENNYQLKSLKDVEEYIKNNKHLPGIPSAEQLVKEGGIDMNEMFARQMEKIEELTLYIIEQNKKFTNMQAEIDELRRNSK